MKTGEYETLLFATLTPDEQAVHGNMKTDARTQLDNDIRLITIRELRMMNRIKQLQDAQDEHGMTMVKSDTTTENTEIMQATGETLGTLPATVTKVKQQSEGVLGQIQAIEEALTRTQATKAKLIELRAKLDDEDPDDGQGIEALKRALDDATEAVWEEDEDDEAGAE